MKPEYLDKAVMNELDMFAGACLEDIREAAKEAGKAAVKTLKNTSPGTKYPKNWKMQVETPRTGASVTVYNDKLYMLAHLLEYGHPKVNGGRVAGHVHIAPAEAAANAAFERELTRRIENGA